ncbi:unnamed protein product [Prunus brigantina]
MFKHKHTSSMLKYKGRSKQKPASQCQIERSNAPERRVNSRKIVEPGH